MNPSITRTVQASRTVSPSGTVRWSYEILTTHENGVRRRSRRLNRRDAIEALHKGGVLYPTAAINAAQEAAEALAKAQGKAAS